MTVDSLIQEIIEREGGFVDNPADRGGRTIYGIAERANPDAWAKGPPTLEQAKAIYLRKYVQAPGFLAIEDEALRAQLGDFGVNSGPLLAIQKLQLALGVEADGILGQETLKAANAAEAVSLGNRLMAERLKMFGRIVAKDKKQAAFVSGWINRALAFLR